MSWIGMLYETYDNCQSSIGYSHEAGIRPLLPICHITSQAHIEIVIDGSGNFRRVQMITDKNEATTILPSTEGSASRSGSRPENHPLCDKLQYVAGDFLTYGGEVTSGFANKPEQPFIQYVESLSNWCQSDFLHPKASAVLKYVQKKNLIRDLIDNHIIQISDEGKILAKKDVIRDNNTIDLFSVVESQDNAFVRWVVEIPGDLETKVWRDKSLWESWINYYLSNKKKEPFCYVTGEDAILSTNHPKYIRREGDGAKLISSNDTSGFTYRGRFLTDQQAFNVSLEVSQKAHFALSWLISRQGYKKDDLAIVAWANSGIPIPQPTDDILSILGADNLPSDGTPDTSTAQEFANKLKLKIAGYGKNLGSSTNISVICLDSATPGRMAITYYRELKSSEFLERIDDWHTRCAWLHRYRFVIEINRDSGKKKRRFVTFVGAPAPSDIAETAYGKRLDDKLRKATIERILPCIIDQQPIPRDIVESAVRRASNRTGIRDPDDVEFFGDEEYTWKKTLSIACSLFKFYIRKENYSMTLDTDRKTRDYLYGRLLALADSLEEWALDDADEHRATNAARLMQRFAEHPYSTWRTIELSLVPAKARLGGKSKKRQQMIDEVIASFNPDEFLSDKRLSGEFLLGYHCQREYLRNRHTTSIELDEEDDLAVASS